jgi:hypothetical protein
MFVETVGKTTKIMKTPWISLDPEEIDSTEQEARKGVHLEFSLSPYDIPEGVRGYYCDDAKRFIIEFKYMTEEPVMERKLSEHVSVREGRNSGRLHDVLIDVDALNVDRITTAIREVQAAPIVGKETKRQRLNSRLFNAVQERLIPTVAAAV